MMDIVLLHCHTLKHGTADEAIHGPRAEDLRRISERCHRELDILQAEASNLKFGKLCAPEMLLCRAHPLPFARVFALQAKLSGDAVGQMSFGSRVENEVKGPFTIQPNIHENPVINHLKWQREVQLALCARDFTAEGRPRKRRI